MKRKIWSKLSGIFLAASLLAGIGLSIKAHISSNEVEAKTTQTHRRIYAVLKGDWDNRDGDNNRMFIHYWGGSSGTDWNSCPQMARVNDSYWRGMFFYDVPVDVTDFLVKAFTGSANKNSNQSENISISSIFPSGDYKVPFIGGWVADGSKRSVEVGDNAGGSNQEVANVLSYIDSCSTSYAGGYNSHPQLKKLFIDCSTLDSNFTVTEQGGRPATTIGQKCTYLQARHAADQASALTIAPKNDDSLKNLLIILMAFTGVSLVGFLYLKHRKKVLN